MKHYKFIHLLKIHKTVNILAKNKKQAFEILYRYYTGNNYYLN